MTILSRILHRYVKRRDDVASPAIGIPIAGAVTEPFSPASDPPKAPAIMPWAEWQAHIDNHYTPPGWTLCKLRVRGTGKDESGEVLGIVKNGYGAYLFPYFVVAPLEYRGARTLGVAVNARSGFTIGICGTIQAAVEMAEIAMRLSKRNLLDLDPNIDPEAFAAFHLFGQALGAAGYTPMMSSCLPVVNGEVVPGAPLPVWVRPEIEATPPEVRPS